MPQSCYLTETGLRKIEEAVGKLPDTCFFKKIDQQKKKTTNNLKISQQKKKTTNNLNFSELERSFSIQAETIKKVLKRKGGVNGKTLENLFEELAILSDTSINLEDEDYIEKKRENEKTIADTNKSREAIATPDQVLVLPVGRIPCFIRNI